MKLGVTAVSGHLGSEIVRALKTVTESNQIVGVARSIEKASGLNVELRPGDYNSYAQMKASLSGVDTLLLVSGMDAPEKRIEQHRNVINAARETGVTKLVYTSVQGAEQGNAFSPIIQSNRQTEEDVRDSGLDWVIGRNGIYIEPDIDCIDSYRDEGEIANCAADGRCGYTTRPELAYAYAKMLIDPTHNGKTYNLHGEAITQTQLARYVSAATGSLVHYRTMEVDDYLRERVADLGEFMGTVIAGIYEGIRNGAADNRSDYQVAAGRPHQSWQSYFADVKSMQLLRD